MDVNIFIPSGNELNSHASMAIGNGSAAHIPPGIITRGGSCQFTGQDAVGYNNIAPAMNLC